MRGENAGAGGPTTTDNLIKFPGGRVAQLPPPRRPDADLIIGAAARIQGLAEHASAVRRALANTPIPMPSGVLEWLAAVEGQCETQASLVEADALLLQGADDVA